MRINPWIGGAGAWLLFGYLVLSWIGIHAGIESLDAHGVMRVAQARATTGAFEVSRPPGHPLNEYLLVPAFARVMLQGVSISSTVYGFYQLTGGLVALAFFWFLLRELAVSAARRLLAAGCLIFSPHFLIESSDGEEFLWGMALVFAALLLVSRLAAGKGKRCNLEWGLAVTAAVMASGCRIEFGAVALGVVFVSLLVSDRGMMVKIGFGVLAVGMLALLWSPVLIHHGAQAPYANPLSLKVRLGVGLYKIVFHALGVVPLGIAMFFFVPVRGRFQIWPPFGPGILRFWLPWLILIFFVLFFVYPTKIQVVLPGVAFLILWGAVSAGNTVWACFVVACLGTQLAQLDCFENRVWTGLKLRPSLWEQSLTGKPAFKARQLEASLPLAAEGRRLVVANVWPWDFDWQEQKAGVSLPVVKSYGFATCHRFGNGLVTTRAMLDDPDAMQGYVAEGYEVWMDADLYREMYMRYDLAAATPESAKVNGVLCRFFKVKP